MFYHPKLEFSLRVLHHYHEYCRDVVSEDIEDFEYTPKPTFPGKLAVLCCNEHVMRVVLVYCMSVII